MLTSKTAITIMAMAVIITGSFFGLRALANPPQAPAPETARESVQGVPVVTSQVRSMVFKEQVKVTGSVEAVRTALVSARVPGIIDDIFVEEGDVVAAGITRLFQTDHVKLKRAVEIAGHQVDVSAAVVSARRATLARVKANLDKIRLDLERYQRLYEQGAVTQNVLETQETMMKAAAAELAEVEAGLTLAQTQEKQAKSNLEIARKDLSDALVIAPLSGTVSHRMCEPGEMAGPGTPIIRIDDLSLVEISAYLPETHYARVTPGKTLLAASVQGVELREMPISFKSPVINKKLRTFEVKARLQNPPAGVVPGAMADAAVILQVREGLGAPRESVLRRTHGQVLFTVSDGLARMVSVQTGLEMGGWIEITGEALTPGMSVVRMGQEQLNDGTPVTIVPEGIE